MVPGYFFFAGLYIEKAVFTCARLRQPLLLGPLRNEVNMQATTH